MINIIVAASLNNVIGKDNTLIWRQSADLKRFKELTTGKTVIMGRKTFESIGSKPLPGRLNIVLTRQIDLYRNVVGIKVVNSVAQSIEMAEAAGYKEIFIIGGSELYEQMFPQADKVYLTRVHASFSEADTYIDPIDLNLFELESSDQMQADEKHAVDYSFECWKRKKQ